MKKLMMTIAALAAVACGCKSIRIETDEWSAEYFSVGQENDIKGLKASKAGGDVTLEVEQVRSHLDPAAQDALRTAAAALAAASRACAACATGGVSEAAAAASSAASGSCPGGACEDK